LGPFVDLVFVVFVSRRAIDDLRFLLTPEGAPGVARLLEKWNPYWAKAAWPGMLNAPSLVTAAQNFMAPSYAMTSTVTPT
jgi:hypothetical protein